MPCWIYMRGDPDAVMSNDSVDAIMKRIDEAGGEGFISFTGMPYAHDDQPRTGYVRVEDISVVLAMHPRQYEADLDEPPDWYTQYDAD